jgi:hypothetical protein
MKNKINANRTKTQRGFQIIEFKDRYDNSCELQQSSLADYDQPGTSAVWLGISDPKPQIMTVDAIRLGIKAEESNGWVPYPIPSEVLLSTRMHLDLEQAKWLVTELQYWIENGKFKGKFKAYEKAEESK